MVLNNKGQVIFYTLMLGVVVVLLAMALTPVVKQFADSARNASTDNSVGLDCSNDTITDYAKSQCILVDSTIPYFFFGLIGIALLIIGAKVVLG